MTLIYNEAEIRHLSLFCGLGGMARGFNRGDARVGNMRAKMRCIGGIDIDSAAIKDFERLTGARGTVLDMFDRDQYIAFHGKEPPADWREATPEDIRRAANYEHPHIVALSSPCKGLSGLLSNARSASPKYQALNRLTVRGIWLMLEAFRDDLPELVIFENVPRIATRGRALLDQICDLLRMYGYAVAETTHDCGELGWLAQSRKRFLLVARHTEKVPPFLYEPKKRPLRAVGEILGKMPMPGNIELGGPMHSLPSLHWKTWVRLAFVEAGSDWRSLNKLNVVDGKLADYLLIPDWFGHVLGVTGWQEPIGAIIGNATPTAGKFAVADPRVPEMRNDALGVVDWQEPSGTVTGNGRPACGAFSVVRFDEHARTITGASHVAGGSACVADPRMPDKGYESKKYKVTSWDEATRTVIGGSTTGEGAFAVADPRVGFQREKGDDYLTAGHYGVIPWTKPTGAVSSAASADNGRWSVADPRMPEANESLVCVIKSLDETWHRPFTTLELAALQSLVDPDEMFTLEGKNDGQWRERIGNAVPPAAAEAIASVMAQTLLLAWSGQTFMLSTQAIWVQPLAIALSVNTR